MKQFITLLTFLLFITIANSQTVPEEQKSMITKVTATWCSNCGSWGWNLYENLAEDNSSKALLLKAHYSGNLVNNIGTELAENFQAQSQPRFILDNTDQNASGSSSATKRTEIKEAVDNTFLEAPVVNAGLTATLENNEFKIDVKTKFFQATAGEFYTSIYIVEDNVITSQSGHSDGANTSHQDIIRAAAGSTFGEQVANGSVAAGTEMVQSYTVAVDDTWNVDNLEFVAIVWSKSENKYIFENGSSAVLTTTSPVKDIAEDIQLNVQPTLVSHDTNISISLEERQDLSIQLINLQGQTLRNIHTGNLASGQHFFNVEKGNLASGIYLISIQGNQGIANRKIIIQ